MQMHTSYDRLWKLLIDKHMNRSQMKHFAGISSTSLAKLGKNQNVSMSVLKKICGALKCNIGDIMDILPESVVDVSEIDAKDLEKNNE